MTLDNYLQDLGEQEVQEEKQLEVRKNPKVDELRKILMEQYAFTFHKNEAVYLHYLKCVKDLEYTAKDIHDFSIYLSESEPSLCTYYRTGIFLSVLINSSREENLTLLFNTPEVNLDNLGMYNTKNVIVFGNVDNCAYKMKSGKITIHGNVRGNLGKEMTGGEIIAEKISWGEVGVRMRGGKIHVKEAAVNHLVIGKLMEGGEIIIDGDIFGDVARLMTGGLITVNGDLLSNYSPHNINKGKLIINGNAKNIGHLLNGGEIEINGNVEHICACDKGTIRVNGEIGKIEEFLGETEIYHKGKRVGHTALSRFYYNKLRKNKFIRKLFG